METQLEAWGAPQRALLKRVRRAAGHSQARCAELLSADSGLPHTSQAQVSRWESGRIDEPGDTALAAIRAYVAVYQKPDSHTTNRGDPPGEPRDSADLDDQFDSIASVAAGEPLLGPRQGALIDAYISRLANGPRLGKQDWRALDAVATALGLDLLARRPADD